ncbi:MAG: ATP-binding protein [Planctomycetes bacterium]|nr:ATP-binding protein [Planctomycetota bacterium]
MNSFKSGMIVSGEDFCGRSKEISELSRLIKSNNRAYIYGERRVGKTSLVLETSLRLKVRPIHIDLMGIKSEDDLCRRIIKGIISYHKKSDSSLLKILKHFSSLRPSIGIDPMSNLPSIGLSPSPKLDINDLESSFDVLSSMNKTFVFFDEFQDILNLQNSEQVMSVMRSKIQQINNLAFVFSGSIRNSMIDIFSREDAPFYKSSFPISLSSIERDDLINFILNRYKALKITITTEFIINIIDICDDIPGDIMRLCESIFFATEDHKSKSVTDNLLGPALEHIYSLEKMAYEIIVQELSNQQLRTLVTLAKIGNPSKVNAEFVEMSGITLVGSVNKAMKVLIKKRIVTVVDGKNKFSNPFLKSWLLTHNI